MCHWSGRRVHWKNQEIFQSFHTMTNKLNFENLRRLVRSTHKAIIMGDFNARSLIWDNTLKDIRTPQTYRADSIIKFINQSDYVVMNNGEVTRISSVAGFSNSAINLTLIHKDLAVYPKPYNEHDVKSIIDKLKRISRQEEEELMNVCPICFTKPTGATTVSQHGQSHKNNFDSSKNQATRGSLTLLQIPAIDHLISKLHSYICWTHHKVK